ncbi:MAG: GNAT family N-acetyltransferase [Alphaproteobacteria bacterium]|nr:GNAT family N-acetyltransferase [Alphaproteobacteria bacterium]
MTTPRRRPDLPEVIVTPRLVLRQGRAADATALAEAVGESLDVLAPWFRWAETLQRWGEPGDLGCRARIAEERYRAGEDPTYFAWDRDDPGRLLGEFVLLSRDWHYDALTYLGWVRRSAWGRGIALEAGDALMDEAFTRARAAVVEAEVDGRNAPSRRLLGRLGFAPYGYTPAGERWAREG